MQVVKKPPQFQFGNTREVTVSPIEMHVRGTVRVSISPKASKMENSETLTLRKQNLYQRNNWLNVQSAHLSDILYGITDIERKWRTAVLNNDINEISRLLKENPELVNWQVKYLL
ncbi:unnamed protein product [Hymenolepis diminuta]|uniref:Uncharacterized protein n=1 Tax=Hymenolepis diminuta TaxID=6216 RepID=A0A564ZAY5_HYMDI|nr:unnamed protein product [Hymenolepis diminuta]